RDAGRTQPTLRSGFQRSGAGPHAAAGTPVSGGPCYAPRNTKTSGGAGDRGGAAVPRSNREPNIVRSVVSAAQVLGSFQSPGEVLRLRDVVQRTGFGKGLCFRLLHTLHHCGLLEKVDESRYRTVSEMRRRRRYRIGYAGQGQDSSFPREVHASLQRAAEREDVELIFIDNRYQPKIALRNAEHLIKERVDLVIEFQTDEAVAPAIAAKYLEANVPLIAIDIPHPG